MKFKYLAVRMVLYKKQIEYHTTCFDSATAPASSLIQRHATSGSCTTLTAQTVTTAAGVRQNVKRIQWQQFAQSVQEHATNQIREGGACNSLG